MLSSVNLKDKSYEQILEEAIAQIPIYSKDWTNYNPSDPGITILENFSAFQELQQSEINDVPEHIKLKLLALAGFMPQEGRTASAYVSVAHSERGLPYTSPGRMKLYAQNICFEPATAAVIKDMRIIRIKSEVMILQKSDLLLEEYGLKGGLYLFGDKPASGDAIELYVSDIPNAGVKAAIYFEMNEQFKRNQMDTTYKNPFAKVKWEISTANGYVELQVTDDTCCFLQSGYVVFDFSEEVCNCALRHEQENAYVIRATIQQADYDIVPCFRRVKGLLMQAIQKDTRSEAVKLPLSDQKSFCFSSYLLKNGYFEVYGKEHDGFYYTYYDDNGLYEKEQQRTYRIECIDALKRSFQFDNASLEEVMVVCRDESVMAYRSLGILCGYDEQIMKLPDNGRVFPREISVLVVEKSDFGERCHIVNPDDMTYGEVNYSVREDDNTIIIHDCGHYEGAELRMGTYATYMGDGGNILADTELTYELDNLKVIFKNSADVTNGCFGESFDQVRNRFAADVRMAVTMVTKEDCRQIVENVPGLSIHKIAVYPIPDKNEIHIAVKPNSSVRFPKLSDIYRNEIYSYLERYRMLTTKIVIEQPIYVPINVTGVIYVKKYFERCRERIEGMIRNLLDGVHSDIGFGDRISFHELYRNLECMDCVEEISELTIFPDKYDHADRSGLDIQLKPNALYYPGQLRIEVTTK